MSLISTRSISLDSTFKQIPFQNPPFCSSTPFSTSLRHFFAIFLLDQLIF
jgi:hypothetical protein